MTAPASDDGGTGPSVPLEGSDIEADPQLDDHDGPDPDSLSFTSSLASSLNDYVYENGRRYHSYRQGEYLFPNDETEQSRLDMLHHIFRLMLGGNLYMAPLAEAPQRVLDIGTGTGIWAMDMAEEFPEARVVGVDLSAIQPYLVPSNCDFFVDDVEDEWPYSGDKAFDFIHQRNMVGAIKDWDRLFAQALEHLRPGGYYEIQEFRVWFHAQDPPLPDDCGIARWQRLLTEGSTEFGKPLNVVQELEAKMVKAGFEWVEEEVLKVPIGMWPKDRNLKQLGQWMQAHAIDSVEPLTLALFLRVLGWPEKECRELMAKVRQEFGDRKQLYVYAHFIHGRKPECD
ncbi:S-adenosyl-L-methionine-dependent methyltransferase [Aspergillus heteromorphus CBS 117.55]|uniref:S-adenosyl-L-methionine-dependent methyltransferase n=1 Tax=Aspergillus heteromorphus CBS 117.55 TaxID=1448321 RepID=A0A317V0Z1_9EURO|nr:S-adenosyl-L-methionine-dependent methyltransferase [Aspergillus heteromorphus CBS 117.55]PWY67943.1 S-adenosyl-L-methionine-dependent methyltransferase [Aspergillus heteromorphus CBS 117.55]